MYTACYFGHVASVTLLLEKGASVNALNSAGFSPLHIAAQEGHLGVVRRLVKAAGAQIDALNKDGATPLYWAAHNGHLETVQFLVRAGKDKESYKKRALNLSCKLSYKI